MLTPGLRVELETGGTLLAAKLGTTRLKKKRPVKHFITPKKR